MSKIALQETIDAAVEMLQNVDRNDTDAMFDTSSNLRCWPAMRWPITVWANS